jgi:hypothetical protein
MTHRKATGLQQIGTLPREVHPELIISKRRLRKVESIECVRLRREKARQNLGFSSRPFVRCGLPVRRPPEGSLLHERHNGQFILQVIGHPSYGLPWEQDRLVPIFLATQAIRQKSPQIVVDSAAEMLSTFGMQQGSSQYRRLVASFQRIFGATIFFGTDSQSERAVVVHRARFNFMREARIWYSRDPAQKLLPGDCQNRIVLSEEFYREIQAHPIPTDLEAARVLSSSPAALDLFMSFLPMRHGPRKTTRAAVRLFRPGQPAGKHRVCASAQVPGEARRLAEPDSGHVARVPCQD